MDRMSTGQTPLKRHATRSNPLACCGAGVATGTPIRSEYQGSESAVATTITTDIPHADLEAATLDGEVESPATVTLRLSSSPFPVGPQAPAQENEDAKLPTATVAIFLEKLQSHKVLCLAERATPPLSQHAMAVSHALACGIHHDAQWMLGDPGGQVHRLGDPRRDGMPQRFACLGPILFFTAMACDACARWRGSKPRHRTRFARWRARHACCCVRRWPR